MSKSVFNRKELNERMAKAKSIALRFPDVEGNDFLLAMIAEIEMLRAYAEMAAPYLAQHPGFHRCGDCKRVYPEADLKNPGCGFGVCPPCIEYRFSPAAGFGVKS